MSERRRVAVLVLVAAVLVLGGTIDATHHRGALGSVPHGVGLASAEVSSRAASSSAWFCPGPLPVGNRPDSSSLAVANLAPHGVTGDVHVTLADGRRFDEAIDLAPRAQTVVDLVRTGPASFASATVELNGDDVGVAELVEGRSGPATSPCADRLTQTAYFPGGSTIGADNVTLSVFDPGATPAVADVSISTGTSTVSPAAFQGVPVGPGQMVTLGIGHAVPERPIVAATVTSTGGGVVAGALVTTTRSAHAVTEALTTGTVGTASSWSFPPGPLAANVGESFSIFDPGPVAATVKLSLQDGPGVATLGATVAAGSVVRVATASTAGLGVGWATITSAGGVGIVVSRSSLLTSTARRIAALTATGPGAVRIPAGAALSSGVPAAASHWLLAGGLSNAAVGEAVTVANPSAVPVTVEIGELDGTASGTNASASYAIAARGSLVVDAGRVTSRRGPLALVVDSSSPVIAGALVYARGSTGFATPSGIVVAG